MNNSTRHGRARHHQSAKPYPDFHFTAHPTGRWCKKVRGRIIFFGKLEDPQAALDKWLRPEDFAVHADQPAVRSPWKNCSTGFSRVIRSPRGISNCAASRIVWTVVEVHLIPLLSIIPTRPSVGVMGAAE